MGLAYGIVGLTVGLSYGIVFYRGAGASIKSPESYVRTLILLVMPEVILVLGLVFSLQAISYSVVLGPESLEVVRAASFYMMRAAPSAILSAGLALHLWDFVTPERWLRNFIVSALGLLPGDLLFALALAPLSGS